MYGSVCIMFRVEMVGVGDYVSMEKEQRERIEYRHLLCLDATLCCRHFI